MVDKVVKHTMEQQRIASVLLRALGTERDGYQFYRMASEQSEDQGARDVFAELAEEERAHFETLQRQYRNLIDGADWDPASEWERGADRSGLAPPFGERFRKRLADQHVAMSALSIGILVERNSYVFYKEQSEQPFPEQVRALFRELAAWEDRHYQLLLRQDEALRDDYWQANRFSPLD